MVGSTAGVGSPPRRFRTIQVWPKDFSASLQQVESAVDRSAAPTWEGCPMGNQSPISEQFRPRELSASGERRCHENEWDRYADRCDGFCSRRKPARYIDLAGAKGCWDFARRLAGGLWPRSSAPQLGDFP